MSGHGHHDADTAHEAHDHQHEATSDDFPDDEPRSPGWLPLLGGALFLAGILAFFVFGGSDAAADDGTVAAVPAATAVPALAGAAAAAAARPAMRLPAGQQLPAGHVPVAPHQ